MGLKDATMISGFLIYHTVCSMGFYTRHGILHTAPYWSSPSQYKYTASNECNFHFGSPADCRSERERNYYRTVLGA